MEKYGNVTGNIAWSSMVTSCDSRPLIGRRDSQRASRRKLVRSDSRRRGVLLHDCQQSLVEELHTQLKACLLSDRCKFREKLEFILRMESLPSSDIFYDPAMTTDVAKGYEMFSSTKANLIFIHKMIFSMALCMSNASAHLRAEAFRWVRMFAKGNEQLLEQLVRCNAHYFVAR